LSNAGLGTCAKLGIEDLLSLSGFQLILGAYLISRIAKFLILPSFIRILTQDTSLPDRIFLISEMNAKMTKALNEAMEKLPTDPQFVKAALIAKQFLRLSPHIVQEMHDSLAIDHDQAQEILIKLQTACRQILAKQALDAIQST
jgi:hypothetical protein